MGILNKKDDLAEGGKRVLSRKWTTLGAVLTGSHLLFCRDPAGASASLPSPDGQLGDVNARFRPDEIYSLKEGIAVYDRSYKKVAFLQNNPVLVLMEKQYNHTFRFVLPDGRHLLLQAANDEDLHQWISCINYASTFNTVGVRMRSADVPDGDIHLTGATPHLHLMMQLNERRQSCGASMTLNEFADVKKIRELDTKISALQLHLESDERHVRNIAILTPFRKTTRSKLLTVIQNLAEPLMRMRLEMEKLKCYRTVLLSDLISESRL
jgi:hypothetical protein